MWNRAVGKSILRDRFQQLCGVITVRASSSTQQPPKLESVLIPVTKKNEKHQKISRAMRAYLERASNHEKFISERREEFELGKRHLANIMGWDPHDITQENIDEAIAYLLPSGLFEPRARPMMKPPEVIFAQQKLAEFDLTGRPFNPLFYTSKGNFYSLLHEAISEMIRLNELQKKMFAKGIKTPEASEKFNMLGHEWIKKNQLIEICVEKLKDENYDYFVRTMERLAEHPYSNSAKSFLLKYLVPKPIQSFDQMILPLMHDENGRPYMEARAFRKTARAIVKVTGNGTGKMIINNSVSVEEYFPALKDRLQVMFPLQFVGLLNKVDVDATVYYKHDNYDLGEIALSTPEEQKELVKPLELLQGRSCEAGAIRLGIAKALCSFITAEDVTLMRLSGLLTQDVRRRERKKPGQRGARRKYPWRKR